MQDLRILESITPSTIGGAEIYVADLRGELTKLGAHVDVFCPSGRSFVDYAAKRGIQCVSWKTHGKIDPLTVIRLKHLIKARNIDVLHTHLSTASLLGAFAAKLVGVPSVAHVHGMNSVNCFTQSSMVIAVSKAVKSHLCAQGMDPDRIRVVHNGLDLANFKPIDACDARLKLGYASDTPLLGVFGRLSQEKGQRIAIQAMLVLLRRYPKAHLLLVGHGKDEEALKARVIDFGLEDKVIFPGFTRDIRTLMSACDVVVVPSLKEGFGMAAIEAMALSRPVIATAVGGLPEIVVHEDTGFAVPAGDFSALAEYACDLLADRSLREKMGLRGRERVESCFELSKQTKLLLSHMTEAVANQHNPVLCDKKHE